jgi:hypothetical protein
MTAPKEPRPPFERLEEQLQAIFEDKLPQLLQLGLKPARLARKLAQALEDSLKDKNDVPVAPSLFRLQLHPTDLEKVLANHPNIAQELAEHLIALATDAHIRMNQAPIVALVGEEDLEKGQILVDTDYGLHQAERTQRMELPSENASEQAERPPKTAHLIVGGEQVTLDRPVFNIGRRPDNHLVLEERRISRQHCQLRRRFGHYVIYDLQSKDGTYVNDKRIREHRLQPGDVIGLAGIRLVYLEDEPDEDTEGTRPLEETSNQPIRSNPRTPGSTSDNERSAQ